MWTRPAKPGRRHQLGNCRPGSGGRGTLTTSTTRHPPRPGSVALPALRTGLRLPPPPPRAAANTAARSAAALTAGRGGTSGESARRIRSAPRPPPGRRDRPRTRWAGHGLARRGGSRQPAPIRPGRPKARDDSPGPGDRPAPQRRTPIRRPRGPYRASRVGIGDRNRFTDCHISSHKRFTHK